MATAPTTAPTGFKSLAPDPAVELVDAPLAVPLAEVAAPEAEPVAEVAAAEPDADAVPDAVPEEEEEPEEEEPESETAAKVPPTASLPEGEEEVVPAAADW